MNRREVLNTSLVGALLSQPAMALLSASAFSAQKLQGFYDERFPLAQTLTAQLLPAASTVPVRSDVTQLWNQSLQMQSRLGPLALAGVTTETFGFCLQRLLQTNCHTNFSLERISQDLYAWTIHTSLRHAHKEIS